MKEAAGEANLTVVTIILIAAIVAIVTPIITNMMKTTSKKACCSSASGIWVKNTCADGGNGAYDAATYTECAGK